MASRVSFWERMLCHRTPEHLLLEGFLQPGQNCLVFLEWAEIHLLDEQVHETQVSRKCFIQLREALLGFDGFTNSCSHSWATNYLCLYVTLSSSAVFCTESWVSCTKHQSKFGFSGPWQGENYEPGKKSRPV